MEKDIQQSRCEASSSLACSPSDSQRLDSIWKTQQEETEYWVREWLDGLESRNVSIHRLHDTGMEHTIIFDMDDKTAVLIETDTTSPNPEDSHKYMMIESRVMEKLATIFHQANAESSRA